MKALETIECARLALQCPQHTDAEAIFARYASDPVVTRFVGWPRHASLTDTEAFLAFSKARFWEAPGWHSRRRTEPRLVTFCRRTHGVRDMPPKLCKQWSVSRAVLGFGGSTRFVTPSIVHPGGFWRSAASFAKASCTDTLSSPTCGQASCLMSSVMLCSCNAEIGPSQPDRANRRQPTGFSQAGR